MPRRKLTCPRPTDPGRRLRPACRASADWTSWSTTPDGSTRPASASWTRRRKPSGGCSRSTSWAWSGRRRPAAAAMRRQGGGVVVNVASAAALRAIPLRSGYSASKSRRGGAYARDGPRRSRARGSGSTRWPPATRAPSWSTPLSGRGASTWMSHRGGIPLGRPGTPEEIAAATHFLASPGARGDRRRPAGRRWRQHGVRGERYVGHTPLPSPRRSPAGPGGDRRDRREYQTGPRRHRSLVGPRRDGGARRRVGDGRCEPGTGAWTAW